MNQVLKNAVKHWQYVAPLATYPKNEKEFNALTVRLDELLEIVGGDERHPLMGLIDVVSHLIEAYETDHADKHKPKGVDALRYLMDVHQLKQADLPEIASQGVMSEILNGKRALSLRQIKLLAERFSVSIETFID